jgi:hypothetical protein
MRYLNLILLLVILVFDDSGIVFADDSEVKLSSDLVREIIEGHKFIEQSTVCFSGTIVKFERVKLEPNSDFASIQFEPYKQYQFCKKRDLMRVEYIQPREGTEVAPDHKYNDVTVILLRTKDYDYYYDANATTGNPSASVTRSKKPSKFVDAYLQTDLYRYTNILTTLPGFKVIEILQKPISKIERREYGGIPDALWITGLEEISKGQNGNKEYANWSIILNPNSHYALLYHESYGKDENNNFFIHCIDKVTSHITDNGVVVPKEIIEDWYIKDDGRYIDRRIVNITSTDAPDDALFFESSFKDTGRNYTLIDESPDGRPMSKQYIDVPQSWLKTPRNQNEVSFIYYIDWTRVCFALTGFLMLLIAFFLFRRSKKNENKF